MVLLRIPLTQINETVDSNVAVSAVTVSWLGAEPMTDRVNSSFIYSFVTGLKDTEIPRPLHGLS